MMTFYKHCLENCIVHMWYLAECVHDSCHMQICNNASVITLSRTYFFVYVCMQMVDCISSVITLSS
jgi:hypothetical protein